MVMVKMVPLMIAIIIAVMYVLRKLKCKKVNEIRPLLIDFMCPKPLNNR